MSFKAYLLFDGEQYELTACHVTVHRKANVKGQPASKPLWIIFVVMDSMDDTKITEWMVNPHLQKDGEIEIYKTDEDAKLKVISFQKAYCVNMIDNFYTDVSFMKCSLQIVGEQISIGEATLIV
ncbi:MULTISPECIES: type VI secretion system tube protein TssD [Xanthocytophaga]|uniref:Type VI secretion system tube protein TssD n=2 Tax=Xanthocytophaga TaxID=3078918 RepID=A0AAE3QVB5_9BACT|nr:MULTISPECIES: type VI secretion system tube protein TssD [Xanthocytophaga]MDJ1486117.1 type VI secretion system tube protein TssD [Xanthocytophaga flavus]MDJ1503002.1 type VI secretion system tube protein TssD [Xanthocytophaga agilis]